MWIEPNDLPLKKLHHCTLFSNNYAIIFDYIVYFIIYEYNYMRFDLI